MEHFLKLTKLQIATGKCTPTKQMSVMCCTCNDLCLCVCECCTNKWNNLVAEKLSNCNGVCLCALRVLPFDAK